MSLINSMLRDLEARRSDGASAAPFLGQVRAVPARTMRATTVWLGAAAGGVVLLAVAAVAGQGMWRAPTATTATTAPTATTPQPAVKTPLSARQEPAAADQASDAAEATAASARTASDAGAPAMPVASGQAATQPRTKPAAQPDASTAAASSVVVASVRPANRPAPAIASAPAGQTTGAGSRPAATPAHRQAIAPDATPQAPALREPTPQPATPAPPAAEPPGIVRESVSQPEAAMRLARQQLQDNALHDAILTLQRALPQAADRADFHAFLAALLQRDDRHRAAVEHYTVALRGAPGNGVWWMGLGISCQALQMAAQAQQAYRSAQASGGLSPELAAFVDARLAQLQRP